LFIHICSCCHSLTHSCLSNSHNTSRYLTHSCLSNSHHTSLTHSYPSNSHHTSRYFLNGFIGGLAETGTTIVLTNKFADRLAAVTASIGTVAGIGCLAGPPLGGILYNIPSGGNAGDPWWVNTHTHSHLLFTCMPATLGGSTPTRIHIYCSLVCRRPLVGRHPHAFTSIVHLYAHLFSQHTRALEIRNSLARYHPPSLFACLGSTRPHPPHLRTLSVGTHQHTSTAMCQLTCRQPSCHGNYLPYLHHRSDVHTHLHANCHFHYCRRILCTHTHERLSCASR
jgi:hypothetical protein